MGILAERYSTLSLRSALETGDALLFLDGTSLLFAMLPVKRIQLEWAGVDWFCMAVTVDMHHTGCDPGVRADTVALIEHVLSDRPGEWRVSIIGSQANDRWEMKDCGAA